MAGIKAMRSARIGLPGQAVCQLLECRMLLAAAADPVPLRINAGGSAYTDSLARSFEADDGFTGGAIATATYSPANTDDAPLFQSYRHGADFSFQHALANGNYSVWLEFADPDSTAAGQREMDVSVEGTQVLSAYDVFADAGPQTAIARNFDVKVTDGILGLNFHGVTGEAIVSAIVATPTDIPQVALPYDTHGLNIESNVVHSAANLRGIGQAIMLFADSNRSRLNPPNLESTHDNSGFPADIYANPRSTLVPRGELSELEKTAWIRQRNDYIYLGAGQRIGQMPPTSVLAYENPTRMSGNVDVLFADGHVESLTRAAAAALIGFDPNMPTDPPPRAGLTAGDPATIQSQVNLRQIGNGLMMWSSDFRGVYPDAKAGAYVEGTPAEAFVNPRGTSPMPPAGMSSDQAIAWINATTDYIYLAGRKNNPQNADEVLMYENSNLMRDGINFLFADGHTEFREMRWAMETLSRSRASFFMTRPIANIDGIHQSADGADIVVTGAGVRAGGSPAILPAPIAGYMWDFHYDGVSFHVDARGQTVTVPGSYFQEPGPYTIALLVYDASGVYSDLVTSTVTVADLVPPSVAAMQINDGNVQRSMVNSLTIAFSEPITLATDAVQLLARNGTLVHGVTLDVTNPSYDDKTWLVRFSGQAVVNWSLPDGTYRLVISSAGVVDRAGKHMTSDYTFRFHRIFGDADGDRDVDQQDLVVFRQAWRQQQYIWWLDSNGNGILDNTDNVQLRLRLRRRPLI